MLKRPLCPLKNLSHNGDINTGPLVKNMNATFGILWNGYFLTFGTMEARQINSRSVMWCMSFDGCTKSSNLIFCVGGGGKAAAAAVVVVERGSSLKRRLKETFLSWKVSKIPEHKPKEKKKIKETRFEGWNVALKNFNGGTTSGSFENSYISENLRTPKPLTFSKNRLRRAKNRSNTSPVAKKFRKNDFFFQKILCICAKKSPHNKYLKAKYIDYERFGESRSWFFERNNGLRDIGNWGNSWYPRDAPATVLFGEWLRFGKPSDQQFLFERTVRTVKPNQGKADNTRKPHRKPCFYESLKPMQPRNSLNFQKMTDMPTSDSLDIMPKNCHFGTQKTHFSWTILPLILFTHKVHRQRSRKPPNREKSRLYASSRAVAGVET
ncbi:hypothetical protein LXL04_021340 [Taraxacum kok-saghyz]